MFLKKTLLLLWNHSRVTGFSMTLSPIWDKGGKSENSWYPGISTHTNSTKHTHTHILRMDSEGGWVQYGRVNQDKSLTLIHGLSHPPHLGICAGSASCIHLYVSWLVELRRWCVLQGFKSVLVGSDTNNSTVQKYKVITALQHFNTRGHCVIFVMEWRS